MIMNEIDSECQISRTFRSEPESGNLWGKIGSPGMPSKSGTFPENPGGLAGLVVMVMMMMMMVV